MKSWFGFLSVLLFSASSLGGEVYVKTKVHTDAMNIKGNTIPARDEIIEQWIGDGVMAHLSSKQHSIVNVKEKTMYLINPQNKSYVQAELPLDFKKLLPQEVASMADMMKPTVTVTATKESKKIGQWNCTAYDMSISMMGNNVKTRVWATKDVPVDLAKYRELYSNLLKSQFMDQNSIKELDKIDGFHILSDTSTEMMGSKMHSTVEVVEISVKNAPAGTFQPPAGYTKKSSLALEDLSH